VLWHCWLGVRKSIRPVKNWVMRCWCSYLSAEMCRLFAYGPADATASQTPSSLALFKSRLVLPFWYWLTQVVLGKPWRGRETGVVLCMGGMVAKWLACWTQVQKGLGLNQSECCRVTVLGKLFTPTVPLFTKQQNGRSPLKGCWGNCRPGGK